MIRTVVVFVFICLVIIALASCSDETPGADQPQQTLLRQLQAAGLAGEQFCPAGAALSGKLCVQKGSAIGPFPKVMRDQCVKFGGGAQTCASDRWESKFAASIRGQGNCPVGTIEQPNGLCVEGVNAFGPFPVALVSACKAAGGGPACETMRIDAKFAGALLGRIGGGGKFPMAYLARRDFGIRTDGFGDGRFGAARGGGSRVHAGVDILMPVGTPVLAPCDGQAVSGNDPGGFGFFVTVTCALPASLTDGSATIGEFLFGHMQSTRSGRVTKGQEVGRSGDSGNARGTNPHIHTEFRITSGFAPGFAAGREEFDAVEDSRDLNVTGFVGKLQAKCFTPTGLRTIGPVSRGTLVDPFLVLSCLSGDKPALQKPTFQSTFVPWSAQYSARAFDVNVGQR